MKKTLKWLLFIFVAVMAFIIRLINPDKVTFSFFYVDGEFVLGDLILISLALGMILGATFMSLSLLRSRLDGGKTKRQLAKVEKEVENLRAMPIKDEV